MPAIPPLDENVLQAICNGLGDTNEGLTGSEIGQLLAQCGIDDPSPVMTKRVRLFEVLKAKQQGDRCANNVLKFVQDAMAPVRFIGQVQRLATMRERVNTALLFCGYSLAENGTLTKVREARTLAEAQQRASRLRAELVQRKVHPDVLRFCRAELLQDNYFHTVFEAAKSVAEKIRQRTGLSGDGANSVDEAFGLSIPLLAINSLRTDTEKSEQKGFANLLRGIFGTFRNVTAHAPKIVWPIDEQDALDLLSMVSYLHRRLDSAVSTGLKKGP